MSYLGFIDIWLVRRRIKQEFKTFNSFLEIFQQFTFLTVFTGECGQKQGYWKKLKNRGPLA